MRQLCNASYAAMIEHKSDDERRKLDNQLDGRYAATTSAPTAAQSRGTQELMSMMSRLKPGGEIV